MVAPLFAAGVFWALNFAVTPRIPLVGDANGDGYADLICVYPLGASIIDVCLTTPGGKASIPFQGLNPWGKDCRSATCVPGEKGGPCTIYAVFADGSVRAAKGTSSGHFTDVPVPPLPTRIAIPTVIKIAGSANIYDAVTGRGWYLLNGEWTEMNQIRGYRWQDKIFAVDKDGRLGKLIRDSWGRVSIPDAIAISNQFPDQANQGSDLVFAGIVFNQQSEQTVAKLHSPITAFSDSIYRFGDADADGDEDVFEFRYGTESHTAYSVFLHRRISENELDSDADGISNIDESTIGSDKYNSDTDGDGLIDGWETGTYRDLKLKELGCSPTKIDILCLTSRFEQVDEKFFKEQLERIRKYYASLPIVNPDKSTGISLHTLDLKTIATIEQTKGWPELRQIYRPERWRGIVHWMQISPWGGGQADQLGDGGGCGGGGNALYATFIHEFGHQLGLPHEGFFGPPWCPTYSSLMNYAYSYGFEDDGNKVHYSDGRLANFVINENDLSETIPLPYNQVSFLEKGPYRFKLKPNGPSTFIDWNWNGVFGENHVRADVNFSYSTHAGTRDDAGKTQCAPWTFTHASSALILYAQHQLPVDSKIDPTISKVRPGELFIRRLVREKIWDAPQRLTEAEVISDPCATSFDGNIVVAYETSAGVHLNWYRERRGKLALNSKNLISKTQNCTPTLLVHGAKLLVFTWNKETRRTSYRIFDSNRKAGTEWILPFLSQTPLGATTDTKRDEVVLGLMQNQVGVGENRWQIRRFRFDKHLAETQMEWIPNAAGSSRPVLVFIDEPWAGPEGKIYFFALGSTSVQSPWSCAFVAEQVPDKSKNGGWLVKRYYDEWTQSRSGPAACKFGDDILYAYRWVDGGQAASDNTLHVGYRGLGIDKELMGDFNDLEYMRAFGIRHSIMYQSFSN